MIFQASMIMFHVNLPGCTVPNKGEAEVHFISMLFFFVPTAKAGVLLATLACIEFFDDIQIPRRLPHSFRIVDVAADGRCFWSSLFLGVQASRAELFSWGARGRSQQGFCYGKKDLELEQKLVLAFGENLTSMPVGCRERFERGLCAHDKDIDSSLS